MFLNSRSNTLRWNILEFCGYDWDLEQVSCHECFWNCAAVEIFIMFVVCCSRIWPEIWTLNFWLSDRMCLSHTASANYLSVKMVTSVWHTYVWSSKQQDSSHISGKSEPTGVKLQTVLGKKEPLKEVPQHQHSEPPEEQSKGLSPPWRICIPHILTFKLYSLDECWTIFNSWAV